mmetsp:Transcript_31395/g.92036  ORF Transcript_31395/g.92036 Transcript_31395/m.92036 type:complete len:342 (-) Transcript_31395:167-1192(-)
MSRLQSLRRVGLLPPLRRQLLPVRPDHGKLRRHLLLPDAAVRHVSVRADAAGLRGGGVRRRRTAGLPHPGPDAGPHGQPDSGADGNADDRTSPDRPAADLPSGRQWHRQPELPHSARGGPGGLRLHHLPRMSDRRGLRIVVHRRCRLLRHLRHCRRQLLQHGVQRRQDARRTVRNCRRRRSQPEPVRGPVARRVRRMYRHGPVGRVGQHVRVVRGGGGILRPAGLYHGGMRRSGSGQLSGSAHPGAGGVRDHWQLWGVSGPGGMRCLECREMLPYVHGGTDGRCLLLPGIHQRYARVHLPAGRKRRGRRGALRDADRLRDLHRRRPQRPGRDVPVVRRRRS